MDCHLCSPDLEIKLRRNANSHDTIRKQQASDCELTKCSKSSEEREINWVRRWEIIY